MQVREEENSGERDIKLRGGTMVCKEKCEVYSRVVGYYRPVDNWNIGKKEEFGDRLEFDTKKSLVNEFV